MPFLANAVAVWILFVVTIVLLGIGVAAIASSVDEREKTGVFVGAFFMVLALASLAGWGYATTHRVVPINEKWLVIDTSTGKIDGGIRSAGLISKPFIMYQINRYPGATQQPACIDYTPALQEGYELTTHVCFTYDANSLDWGKQFTEHNFYDEAGMLNYWANQTKEVISAALLSVNYTELTTNRPAVSTKIRTGLMAYFETIGVNASNVQLVNWDFTSADVKAYVNQSTSASMKTTVERQLLESAKVARERQLYEIETANQVLAQRGNGLNELMTKMGITSEEQKVYFANQMNWYNLASNPPAGMQIILGVGGNPIIAQTNPVTTNVVPTPVPTAAP